LKEVVEGALGIAAEGIGYNATFVYPKSGGIESLAKAILKSLSGGELAVNSEPRSIDWKRKTLELSSGRQVRYSNLISTISLPALIRCLAQGGSVPQSVQDAARKLRATTVTYVNVAVRGTNRQPWHWIYLPEPEFKAYRIGSASAVYSALSPPGTCSFYVEYSHHGELSIAECEKHAAADLFRSQMIHGLGDILFARGVEIPNAYVLYDEGYGPAKDEILKFLATAGVLTAGRYGQWEYSSMEDAILAGRAAAHKVNA
jgi:protoporphyrinogen oxidase